MPPKRLKLGALPQVAGDINALPTKKLKEIALQRISDVVNGRLRGARLEDMSRTGDLTDCFKLYFDETGGPDPAYRVVYRELAEGAVEVVEVVAVERAAKSFMCTHSLRSASDASPRVPEYQNDPSARGLGGRREGRADPGNPPSSEGQRYPPVAAFAVPGWGFARRLFGRRAAAVS